MLQGLVTAMLVAGGVLLVVGVSLCDLSPLWLGLRVAVRVGWWSGLALGLAVAASDLRRRMAGWIAEDRLRRARGAESEFAAGVTPMLFGEDTQFVTEAADQLAERRDETATPAMLRALELIAESQRPGWRDRAEAITCALGRIGDRRALPLLRRLEGVRGIGLIPAIREAIAAIEPRTSLLRPSDGDREDNETLLRTAAARTENDDAALLRVVEVGRG